VTITRPSLAARPGQFHLKELAIRFQASLLSTPFTELIESSRSLPSFQKPRSLVHPLIVSG